MRKIKIFLSLLMAMLLSVGNVWADPAAVGTTLFSEDFSGYAKDAVPSGSVTTATGRVVYGNANVTYSCTDGGSTTKIYNENTGGGTAPEILVSKSNGTFVVAGIPSGSAQAITVSFTQNKQALSVEPSGTGYSGSVSGKPANAGTRSFDITVADGADATFTLTFKGTGSSNVRVDDILVTVKTAGEGGASAKTLSSVAVSGTPTKTSYYAGDNFDPAGLTVTGTYSDESTAPITSGITWSYDPSQALALNQTSIGVVATVSEIASPKFNVTGLTVTEAPAAVNYEKVTTAPSDWSGEYILVYESGSNAYVYTGVDANNNCVSATISNDIIAIPNGAATLTIASMEGGYSIMVNGGTNNGKYISGTSGSNTTNFTANAVANTLSIADGSAVITAGGTIRFNSGAATLRFRYYKSGQQAVQLYKKVDGAVKPSAELSYATADQKKLTKLGETFTAPTLVNPHGVAVTYASSAESVAEVAGNGAVTIKAAGVAVITASFAGNDDYKEGSASYTIGVTTHAGTEADPYDAADAKNVIDVVGTKANAYVSGKISNIVTTADNFDSEAGFITFYFSADGLTSGQQIEAYKCFGLNSAKFTAVTDIETGATVVITGSLKKYNSTYEFDQNCHLVSYEAPAVPKTHIANTKETAYTVAQAITYAADGVTYDLDDYVYVQGVVYDVKNFSNGAMDIFIKDANAENQFELYKCAGINDGNATTPFDALTDVQVGDVVIGYGQLTVYNSVYEFKQGNYLVDLDREEVVLTDYYEKVTETAGITDGTYLIVYEAGNVAFNGGLETLDDVSNTIEVAITNDNKIGVTTATEAATFFIDVTAGSIQSASGKYIGVTSNSNGLKTSDEANAYSHNFSIDNDGNAVIAAAFEGSTMSLRYNTASNQARFRYYKENGQQAIQLYKLANEVVKANPELAWSGDIEITLGATFTAPTLDNPHSVAGITYASDNEALATVTSAGVISLVADATGTAHITATFAGNDDYKAANVSCTITVNSSTPTPAASGNVVIIAECDSKFYAMTNSLASGALAGVVVEKDGSTIVVSSADDKEAIQWTAAVSGNNTTLKDANNKYIKGSNGASLSLDDAVYNWNWDSEKSCYISSSYDTRGLFFSSNGNVFKGYALSNLESNGYAAIEVIEIDPENIVVTSKVDPQLAYNPASDEITIGGAWSAPSLGYTNGFDGLDAVTYVSNNESVAVVTNAGVISLAGGIGTAVITASFAGNTNYLSGSATYTIVVNDIPDNCDGTDDFENEISGTAANTYGSRATTNKWAAINAQWTTINNEQCYFTLNGKTTAVGKIQSPTLKGGIASLKVRYANTNSEANGVSFKVEIKQGEDVVREYTITKTNAEVSKGIVYTESITNINVEGDFLILITNLSPSNNSTSNKDRLSIGKLCWTNYDTTPEPEPELNYVEARTGLTVGKFYTICMPRNIRGVRGATFWNLNNRNEDGSMVYFVEAEASLDAGKPYIFIATAETLEVAYGEDVADSPVANGALHGTFSAMTQGDFNDVSTANGNSPIYMLVNNQLRQVAGRTGNSLGANRAYVIYNELQAGEPTPAPGRRVLAMPMNENVATGIDALGSDAQPSKIIVNGQLFIIRDGKAYDATGRQVSKF